MVEHRSPKPAVVGSSPSCPATSEKTKAEIESGTHEIIMSKVGKYFSEVRSELQKATWPWDPKEKGVKKYKQLIDSSVVVLIATMLLGAFVALVDFAMVNLMKWLTTGF